MSGPPGAGKSLLAACLPGILPPRERKGRVTSQEGPGTYQLWQVLAKPEQRLLPSG
jgi:energy-coupling factor transporter ATP-binding protein EcfA2